MEKPIKPNAFIRVHKVVELRDCVFSCIEDGVKELKEFFKEAYGIVVNSNEIEVINDGCLNVTTVTATIDIVNPNYELEMIEYEKNLIKYQEFLNEVNKIKNIINKPVTRFYFIS